MYSKDSLRDFWNGSPLPPHPPLSQILVVGLVVVAGLVIVVLLRPRRPKAMPVPDVRLDGIEAQVAVKAQRLMKRLGGLDIQPPAPGRSRPLFIAAENFP